MPINKVVIVGDGLAAWLCASACARALNKVVAIQVVHVAESTSMVDSSLGAPLIAEASQPAMIEFNRFIGYDENALIHATRGGFTLGTALSDWVRGMPVFNPFGEVGSVLGPVSFPHLAYRLRDLGRPIKFSNYSLAALSAQSGRFAKAEPADRSVLSILEYGLHIDVSAYTQALKADAIARGVTQSRSTYERPILNDAGLIDAVVTTQGQHVDGDLFVDCTGAARLLATPVHESKFTDWTRWSPCSHIASMMIPTNDTPLPYTHLVAKPSGWLRIISLQGRRIESMCLHNQSHNEEYSETHSFTPGAYAAPWQKNCVALGGAATVIDPTSSLSLHLLHSGIKRLITLLPSSRRGEQEAIEYNRQSSAEIECARDYSIAHYKLNDRVGDSFWDDCRNMSVPDSLAHRIEIYQSSGRVVMHDGEVVDRMNWVALFDAQKIYPSQYDVVARGIPVQLINEHLALIRQTFLNAVAAMPAYQTFLSQLGKS